MFDLFEYPWVLLILLFLPFVALIVYGRSQRRSGPLMFSRVALLGRFKAGPRVALMRLMPMLRLMALALLVVAAARPSIPDAEEAVVEGIDIYLVLDLSGSMQAIDVSDKEFKRYSKAGKAPPNRFQIAREVLADVIRSRTNDRIGMTVFARDAFLQFPLTLDYGTVLRQLEQLELGDIDGSGTAIGNALGRAVAGLRDHGEEMLEPGSPEDDPRTKIIVLITDGDRRGGNLSPLEAADFAVEHGVKIFPILVGAEGRARVPVGKDLFSGRLTYRYQDYPVDPALLKKIAEKTDGEFYRSKDKKGLETNLHEILDSFERASVQDISSVNRRQIYGGFLGWAVFLLLLEVVLTYAFIRPFP